MEKHELVHNGSLVRHGHVLITEVLTTFSPITRSESGAHTEERTPRPIDQNSPR